MIFLLLPRLFLLSLSPSPSGTLWTRFRLPHTYLSKMAESVLAARAKIHPPCMLQHRVQQEYNSLLVNALNRIFKSNLSLNNFKWLPPPQGFSRPISHSQELASDFSHFLKKSNSKKILEL